MRPKLIILRGLPGSGKSTFAKVLMTQVFEADNFFYDDQGNYNFDMKRLGKAHKWCQDQVEKLMKEHISNVVVSNTSTTEKELEPYLKLAKIYDYDIVSLIVENRHGSKSIHNVPDETMEKMRKRFEIKL